MILNIIRITIIYFIYFNHTDLMIDLCDIFDSISINFILINITKYCVKRNVLNINNINNNDIDIELGNVDVEIIIHNEELINYEINLITTLIVIFLSLIIKNKNNIYYL